MLIYAPLSTLKPVGPDCWIVDGPDIKFYGIPFSTRMTVVRLDNGNIWLHSPTKICDSLAAEVSALGPVMHLIAPNWIHYAYVTEWQAAFPKAVAWAAPGVAARAKKFKMQVVFDHDLGVNAPDDWSGEIDQMIVEGSKSHREAVFFHRASKTLILTDLIENFEARALPFWMVPIAWLAGVLDPDGKAPVDMRQTFRAGKAELRIAVERMISWAPERVILAHGRWYEKDAVTELKRAFRWVL